VEVSPQALVGAQCHARDPEQPIRPAGSELARATQLAPMVRQGLDVGDFVGCVSLEQPLEPALADLHWRRRMRDHRHQLLESDIYGIAESS